MAKERQTPVDARSKSVEKPELSDFEKLAWIMGGAVIATAAASMAMFWHQWFPPAADKVVYVYQTPRCTCARSWSRSLEQGGFVVRTATADSLKETRRTLSTPSTYRGCHVGVYLGYFLEGHVPASAVRDLAIHRPVARGLVTQPAKEAAASSAATVDENSVVFLVDPGGAAQSIWYQPPEKTSLETSRGIRPNGEV